MKKSKKHPIQPIELMNGVIRFKANKIIKWLHQSGKLDLNEIGFMEFSADDRQQLAQLLGYSVSGYGDLSYVDDKAWDRFMHKWDKFMHKRGEEYDQQTNKKGIDN